MTQEEYEQKKAECWHEYFSSDKRLTTTHEHEISKDAFYAAFDLAYQLDKQEKDAEGEENEQILSNVEKTGKNFNVDGLEPNPFEKKYKVGDKVVCLNYPDVWREITYIMEDGTYVLDNCVYDIKDSDITPYVETPDDKHNIISCHKKKALLFYEHLLDLVENSGINKKFSEWRHLESEYIVLFGEEIFKEHYENILSQNSTENCDNEKSVSICGNKESYIKTCTGDKLEDHTAQDLEMVTSDDLRLRIAAMAMQGLLNATSVERFTLRINPESIAEAAFEYADALIAKADNDVN